MIKLEVIDLNKSAFITLLVSFLVIINSTIGNSFSRPVKIAISVFAVVISIYNVIVATKDIRKNKTNKTEE